MLKERDRERQRETERSKERQRERKIQNHDYSEKTPKLFQSILFFDRL